MDDQRIIATIKKVMPAVVSITISKHLQDVKKELKSVHGLSDIPHDLIEANGLIRVGGGSGFIVDPSGIVLTNRHVVSDPKTKCAIVTNDDRTWDADILCRDPMNDIAIFKIKGDAPKGGFPTLKLGNSSHLELGHTVIAIGNALGMFKNTVSLGIVSGLSRSVTAQDNPDAPPHELRGLIQTDAAINPGNSGGPLVNLEGDVVGVNTATVAEGHNIGFAIPVNSAKRDLRDIKEYGHIRRPFLGVRYMVIDASLQQSLGLPVYHGALVVPEGHGAHGVIPYSPADRAGLRDYDIIIEAGGQKVTIDNIVQDILEGFSAGDTFELVVLRKGKKLRKKAKLIEKK